MERYEMDRYTSEQEHLITHCQRNYWLHGEPVPTDVFIRLTASGLDAEEVQDHYMAQS